MRGPQITYVVKSWMINANAPVGQPVVEIRGRAPGLMSWLLSLFGIEPTVSLTLTHHTVEISKASVFGRSVRTIPLRQVASTDYGYSKPVQYLIIGLLTLPFLIGVVFLILYVFKKALILGVSDTGAGAEVIQFQRGMIENVQIDEAAAEHVASLIRHFSVHQAR